LPLYHLIGADTRLSSIDVALNKPGREFMLKKALSQIHSAYDFCIIDNPPALNVAVANSLVASDKIIICSSAEAFALDGLMELSTTLDDVHQFMNPALIVDGILITIFNPRTIIGQHIKEQLSKIAHVMNTKVYNTFIRRCNAISVSQSDRKNIFDFPTTKAAIDYGNFIDEFLGGNIYG
ncbi:MAG: ParA family protein, partial [Synergistaceae bacterium]|nr:ParA family protein [Synergistaceae bacterium]